VTRKFEGRRTVWETRQVRGKVTESLRLIYFQSLTSDNAALGPNVNAYSHPACNYGPGTWPIPHNTFTSVIQCPYVCTDNRLPHSPTFAPYRLLRCLAHNGRRPVPTVPPPTVTTLRRAVWDERGIRWVSYGVQALYMSPSLIWISTTAVTCNMM